MSKHVAIFNGMALVESRDGKCFLPAECLPMESCGEEFVFRIGETDYHACSVASEEVPEGYLFSDIRSLWSLLSEDEFKAVGKGEELCHWDAENRFCGHCGAPMRRHTEISKICDCCHREVFPSVAPAVIVLIQRGDEALLVHARSFSRPFFGLVAGFVETGESLEESVAREIYEETSLQVTDIRYLGSQPWPYPSQLMIGFTAQYAAGELTFADGELSEGGFFTRDNLPLLPGKASIARRLIDAWIERVI